MSPESEPQRSKEPPGQTLKGGTPCPAVCKGLDLMGNTGRSWGPRGFLPPQGPGVSKECILPGKRNKPHEAGVWGKLGLIMIICKHTYTKNFSTGSYKASPTVDEPQLSPCVGPDDSLGAGAVLCSVRVLRHIPGLCP